MIEISFTSRFDGARGSGLLEERAGRQNHSMRQSGKQATIRLGFTGSVSEVVDIINFGKVSSVDQAKRLIKVTAD